MAALPPLACSPSSGQETAWGSSSGWSTALYRVLTIIFALNRAWQPTTKRLAARVAPLSIKPDRLAERIQEALTEPDPRRALRVMSEVQLDTVRLAPKGPNIDGARSWLAVATDVLRHEPHD